MKIIGVGDCVLDEYVWMKRLYPGGNSVNVPVQAKRFGCKRAAYIGILGDDGPGVRFASFLEDEAVDISRLRVGHGPMARNFIHLDESGDRSFVGNNGCDVVQKMVSLHLNENDLAFIEDFDLLHTSLHSEIEEILPKTKGRIPISLDFSDAYDEEKIRHYAPGLAFAFLSAGDKGREAEACAYLAHKVGAKVVVLTKGEEGSMIISDGGVHHQKAVIVEVVDTLGAGDAFIASFLVTWGDSKGDILLAAQRASEFAAQKCLHHGAFGTYFPIE